MNRYRRPTILESVPARPLTSVFFWGSGVLGFDRGVFAGPGIPKPIQDIGRVPAIRYSFFYKALGKRLLWNGHYSRVGRNSIPHTSSLNLLSSIPLKW